LKRSGNPRSENNFQQHVSSIRQLKNKLFTDEKASRKEKTFNVWILATFYHENDSGLGYLFIPVFPDGSGKRFNGG
jgi:hypothetical protein